MTHWLGQTNKVCWLANFTLTTKEIKMFSSKKDYKLLTFTGAFLILNSFSVVAQQTDITALKSEAITIVKQFGGALKPELKKALTEGGVQQAVTVCSVKAPEIAHNLTLATNWQVKRVSLKARNNKNAMPDAWEEVTLAEFDLRQQQGESAKNMAKAEIIGNEFRFMKAQGTAPLCLTCHGTTLSQEAKAALKNHYPNDKATGYSLGQIRGAFSLTKQL